MFGKKARDKHYKMEQDGEGAAATATVLTSKASSLGGLGGGDSTMGGGVGPGQQTYHLTVRVEPDGADPYDAAVTYKGIGLRQPLEGEHVPVRVDPEDPTTVVLDVAKIQGDNWARRHPEDVPTPETLEKLKALQARFDAGEMPEGEFRVERAKLLGG
jgi:hypothetical protein